MRVVCVCRNAALAGVTHDIHADVKEDPTLVNLHADAEKFDPRTEQVFKVLQVISACAMSFAHGGCCPASCFNGVHFQVAPIGASPLCMLLHDTRDCWV